MQIIIAGCERVGAYLAHKLYDMGHDLIIIEEKTESLEAVEDLDCVKIQAKAIDVEAQRLAGSETADVFIAVSSNENINVMAAEVAQMIFNVPRVLVRTLNQENNQVFIDMGLETICSTSVQADNIIEQLFESENRRSVDLFGTKVLLKKERLVHDFFGKTITDIEAILDRKIMAVMREGGYVFANPNLELQENDEIILWEGEAEV